MENGSAKFVRMDDGRHIAYRELGCSQRDSPLRSMIALHGLLSSRFGAMPGVREEVLIEYGVRLIAIDRPGYGQSDPHPSQTFRSTCKDIVAVADALHLGKRFWLHGYSMGGAFCWAAARYIPDRVEGIAMWCPVGNMWWKGITKYERKMMLSCYSKMDTVLTYLCKLSPFLFIKWYSRIACALLDPHVDLTAGLSEADKQCMLQPGSSELMHRDRRESLRKYKGFGMAKDFELLNKGWEFEIYEVGEMFKRKIHIWQGDEDRLVPVTLQRWVQKQLPGSVELHELQGEGHVSLFVSTNLDRLTLHALFGGRRQDTSSPLNETFSASYHTKLPCSNGEK